MQEPVARLQAGLHAQGVPGGQSPLGTAGSNWWHWDSINQLPAQPEQAIVSSLQASEVNTAPSKFS